VLAFERHRKDDDMTELPRNDLDRHDWAARASEALAQASPDRCDPKPSEKPNNLALPLT
jgi:hypothetical protein